jgi:ankyrin repeat protein
VSAAGHKDICELLLHSGANVNAQNHTGDTPLHLAVWKSHEAVVALLLKEGGQWKADTTLRNQDGKLAEELARSDAVREIFDKLAGNDSINVVQENDDSDDE